MNSKLETTKVPTKKAALVDDLVQKNQSAIKIRSNVKAGPLWLKCQGIGT